MKNFSATTNIANKVRNTRLPRTKPLMPLFECISNSIHSIDDAKKIRLLKENEGEIKIRCIRNGSEEALKEYGENDKFPIKSFEIIDNGIGLNDENLKSFFEADTDHKIEIGGKGVGRFVCLKAFEFLQIESIYVDNHLNKKRTFDFKASKDGFHNFDETDYKNGKLKSLTKIILNNIKQEYQKNLNPELSFIAKEIVSHFQLYFIRDLMPNITIENQDGNYYDLINLFKKDFKEEVKSDDFQIGEELFTVFLTKSQDIQSHKINFCAHNRSVIKEGLYSKIIDLGKNPLQEDDGNKYFYEAYVVGKLLDNSVDIERIGFDFPDDEELLENEENEFDTAKKSLANIRRKAINSIEKILESYLNKIREEKIEKYKPTIYEEYPQYRSTLHYKKEEVSKLPPNLTPEKLDIELYKIDANWRLEVKKEKIELLSDSKDITNHEDYIKKYEKFFTEFNEIGQADLAKYVVHRKTIIDLLENLIESKNENFENEDLIHNIFFPIRTNSDEVTHDKQNLWLIDERLTYHSFLASDKTFNSNKNISSKDTDRSDLLIYNEAFAFSDSKVSPHNSFTIVEFKKPMRNDYKDYDEKKNPIEQVERYIEKLLKGDVIGRNGRKIEVDPKTPFYVYIVCDITPSLENILKRREFHKTPDGKGYFTVKSIYYSAYIEVLTFDKVLIDSRKRNRILFEKLNIQ